MLPSLEEARSCIEIVLSENGKLSTLEGEVLGIAEAPHHQPHESFK